MVDGNGSPSATVIDASSGYLLFDISDSNNILVYYTYANFHGVSTFYQGTLIITDNYYAVNAQAKEGSGGIIQCPFLSEKNANATWNTVFVFYINPQSGTPLFDLYNIGNPHPSWITFQSTSS